MKTRDVSEKILKVASENCVESGSISVSDKTVKYYTLTEIVWSRNCFGMKQGKI